jgi:hypothetical protein
MFLNRPGAHTAMAEMGLQGSGINARIDQRGHTAACRDELEPNLGFIAGPAPNNIS